VALGAGNTRSPCCLVRIHCIFVLAFLLLQLAPAAPAVQASTADAQETFTWQQYAAELERWSAAAERLGKHPEEAVSLRKQLPRRWSVTVQKQHFLVPTTPLSAELDRIIQKPQLAGDAAQELSARVDLMLQDSRAMAEGSTPNYSAARTKLDRILKRREFRYVVGRDEGESLWTRLVSKLWEWLYGLMQRAGNHPRVQGVLLWGIVIATGVIFLLWFLHTLTHISYRRAYAPAKAAAPPASWQVWLDQAQAAARRGEFRDGIRILFGVAVRRLEESGAWQVDPARTHREYVRMLPSHSAYRPHLMAIATCFERVWYGHMPACGGDYEAVRAELESLL
jgi:Domain of unknown function (DUF4129)